MAQLRRLFWDIETSPDIAFTWRTGYKLTIPHSNILQERAIICICYKWAGTDKVEYLTWDRGDDGKLLKAFKPIADEADELVAHNGDKFDLKWFHTRCLAHGIEPPPERKTIDTLVIARRRFYFNSNRLDYIAGFLGLGGKQDVNFDLWRDIVLDNDPVAMTKMVDYCMQDVVLLEKVYDRLIQYHNPKSHQGVMNGSDKWSCPRCGSEEVFKHKNRVTAKGTVQHQMKCHGCHGYFTISNKAHSEYLEASGKVGV